VLLLSISVSLDTTLGDDVSGRTQASLDASCIAWVWCTSVGDLVIYLALLCKLWRVEKVARFRKGQKILAKHVLGPFVGVIVAAVGILVAWMVVSPPHYRREIVEARDGTLHSIGVCHYDDGGIFHLVLSILFLATVGFVFWLSLRTRHLPESLSDSRRITQTLLAHLLLGLVMLVVKVILVVVSVNPDDDGDESGDKSALRASFFLTKVFYQFAVGMLTLGFLVVPKIYCVRYERIHGNLPPGVRKLVEGRVTVIMNNERLVEVDGKWTSEGMFAAQRSGGGSMGKTTTTTTTTTTTKTKTKRSVKIPLLWSRCSDRTTEASTVDTRAEGGSGRGAPIPNQNKGGCNTDGGNDGVFGDGPSQSQLESQSQSQSQSQRSDHHIPDAGNEFCDVEGGSQKFVMEMELSSKSSGNENGDSSVDSVEH